MKKYETLGSLLNDYLYLNNISLSDLATRLDVDIRTVIRWQKDETLIKSGKEKELVEQTFIPYQVIRNLNAMVPIPVYFDFKIRKYALTAFSKSMPDTKTLKTHLDAVSPRIHSFSGKSEQDIENILKYHNYLYKAEKQVNKELIVEASKHLPEVNLIMYDNAGFYAGHCVVFPLLRDVYKQLKDRRKDEGEINISDFTSVTNVVEPIFYVYSFYADCNENLHYMFNALFAFFIKLKEYIFSALIVRPDALETMLEFGLNKLWEDENHQSNFGPDFKPCFVEGKLKLG